MDSAADPSKINFLSMSYADLPDIMRLEQACHTVPWKESVLADCLRSGYECWKVVTAEHDEQLIGFAIVMSVIDEHHLLNIVVDQPFQGRGYGQAIMDFLLKHSLIEGKVAMLLEVRESNLPAQRLYQKIGFQIIGERKDYYPAKGGGREMAIVMKYVNAG